MRGLAVRVRRAESAVPADVERATERSDGGRAISITELFSNGIGPSGSHTVGPMHAARNFAKRVADRNGAAVSCELFGPLALTRVGDAANVAVLRGSRGERPETTDCDRVGGTVPAIRADRRLRVVGQQEILFGEA